MQGTANDNAVQYCHPAQGGLYLGELITACIFFCFQLDGPITGGGGAYKLGAYNRNFTVPWKYPHPGGCDMLRFYAFREPSFLRERDKTFWL